MPRILDAAARVAEFEALDVTSFIFPFKRWNLGQQISNKCGMKRKCVHSRNHVGIFVYNVRYDAEEQPNLDIIVLSRVDDSSKECGSIQSSGVVVNAEK